MSKESFKGKLIIITAPSGAGKTTIVRHLKEVIPELAFSVSATTRLIRKNEIEGRDYFFKTNDEFSELIKNGDLVEWQEVYENQFYGTLRSEIYRIWEESKHILFDIDVKGATNLKNKFNDKALSIFIKPPSLTVLMERLINRRSETPDDLRRRIKKMKEELSYESEFDISIVNDDLEVALQHTEKIVRQFLVN
ncbi:MAG: guanylate kinase [Saprospirales bacterium]|nr:MAG: guanylate kinase [Saprospirales bacterium]